MEKQGKYYHDTVNEVVEKFPHHSIVEIGTDGGTTAFWALKAMKNFKGWFFTIDPYGDKPYKAGSDVQGSNMGYNDKHYMNTIPTIYKMAQEKGINYLHWKLTSLDWMKIWDEIEFWNDGGKEVKFSMAYLDGDHAWDPVMDEFKFFYDRIPKGGYIVIDDFNLLDGEAEVRLRTKGFDGEWYFNYDDNHHRAYFKK